MKYPIFEKLDLSKHEGEKIPLYFLKIIGREGSTYLAKTGFGGEQVYVISEENLKEGSTVSFYGLVQNGRLISEKYNTHKYPNSPYYLSIAGLGIFLAGFFRRWKVDIRETSFAGRDK